MYIEQSVEEKIRVCIEEISQHKKDLKLAVAPLEQEWIKDELDYWENELAIELEHWEDELGMPPSYWEDELAMLLS